MTYVSAKKSRNIFCQKPLALAVALTAAGSAPAVLAQEEAMGLEEVVVTARKRTESLQDVPISIQALSSTKLDQLGITSFDEYAAMLPTVSFTGIGPGTNRIYMRGASDGGDGNVSGSQPSVGLYLDEQPVTAIGANLDIHIYDIERIEALAGPQGTLYGASSQSGTLRIITNKPDPSAFDAGFDLDYSDTEDGDTSHKIEGFLNIPLGERTAIRLVGWTTDEGGWIDNVPGTRTYELGPGYGYNPNPTLPPKTIDNDRWLSSDQNEVETEGARAALRIDLTEKWVGTASVIYQEQQSDGAFDQDRALDENEIQRFYDDWQDDEFTQYALTLEGELLNHSIVYAGSYMDRDLDYYSDYTAYGELASWVPYYACDYYADPENLCSSLEEYLYFDNSYERTSHELRLQSLGDGPFHYTAGFYYEDAEHEYDQQFTQPFMSPTLWARGRENMFFNTDQKRTDELWAVFGELTYDITDSLRATVGARHYDSTNELEGYTGWGKTNYQENYGFDVDSKTEDDDQIYKFNVTWDVTDDAMVYATYSEGYRVGGLNRDPNVATPTYAPDKLNNYELGWKSTWMDGRLRVNGALYYAEWDDMQFTIYDFSLSPVGNTYNVGEAEITGAEMDFSWLMFDSLTLSGAVAYNDAETTEDFILQTRTGEVDFNVPDGTDLPDVPELKYTLNARYEFTLASMDSFAQLTYTYTDESWNDIDPSDRLEQDEVSNLNLRTGVDNGGWGLELYATNLTDENDNVFIGNRSFYDTATSQRPRTIGIRYFMRFN
jgi:outer membrane receptor protein involved in Fe transport